jgi:predicted GIY-YIG superfamily endonuclease
LNEVFYDKTIGFFHGTLWCIFLGCLKFEVLFATFLSQQKMSTNIYILKLRSGKYYVGKSANPMERYQQHLDGKGSAWTKKYKPVSLEKVISNVSPFDEDKYTKEYMKKHGIENVRGGAYVTEKLDEVQEESLKRELWAATDKCTRCGRGGHFVSTCHAMTEIVKSKKIQNQKGCSRCGRTNHSSSGCYARTDYEGNEICSGDDGDNEEEDDDDDDDNDNYYSNED